MFKQFQSGKYDKLQNSTGKKRKLKSGLLRNSKGEKINSTEINTRAEFLDRMKAWGIKS